MTHTSEFEDVVRSVCTRHRMYVCGGTFYEVCAYIEGYAAAIPDTPISGDGLSAFNTFVAARLGFPQKIAWPVNVRNASRDDNDAINKLEELLTEFIAASRADTVAELVATAIADSQSRPDPEPVAKWRKLSRALHRGDRREIESLILHHPEAELLWESSYPPDVLSLMDEIAESYFVSVAVTSADGKEVQITTPDFGLVTVRVSDGCWRIDATPIIECRKRVEQSSQVEQ